MGKLSLRRAIDVTIVMAASVIVGPLCLLLMLLIRLDSRGNPLFIQWRIGQDQMPFRLFKLRTMKSDTSNLPSHEVPATRITRVGRALRSSKLDELPQLWNILRGEMTFVGPRPCLPTQRQLIEERARRQLFQFLPGITGPAQIQHIDMSKPTLMSQVEEEYFTRSTPLSDVVIVLRTVFGAGRGDVVGGN